MIIISCLTSGYLFKSRDRKRYLMDDTPRYQKGHKLIHGIETMWSYPWNIPGISMDSKVILAVRIPDEVCAGARQPVLKSIENGVYKSGQPHRLGLV